MWKEELGLGRRSLCRGGALWEGEELSWGGAWVGEEEPAQEEEPAELAERLPSGPPAALVRPW